MFMIRDPKLNKLTNSTMASRVSGVNYPSEVMGFCVVSFCLGIENMIKITLVAVPRFVMNTYGISRYL